TLSMSKAFQGSIANRTLPASFGSLSQLSTVDLSRNNLVGGIPSSLSQLRNLNTLTLSYNYLNGSIPSFMNASTFPSLTSIDLSNNQFTLIDKNALSGFRFTNPVKCSVINNPFSCFIVKPINSSCVMPAPAACTLDSLYSQDTFISPSDAQNILTNSTSSDQTILIAAVMTALLRTTKTFSYTSNTMSISLQTYNLSVIESAVIENKIEGQNSSVRLPASTVAEYNEVSVALSSVDSTSLLSFYNQSIRGRVIGVQVYDGKGREVEIGGVTEKINITMGYINVIPSDQEAMCQWWNETERVWSRDGCNLYIDEARLAVCQCNHLTNFSIALNQNAPSATTSNTRTVIIIAVCCAAGGLLLISVAAVLIYKRFGRRKYRAMEDIGMSTMTDAAVKYEEKIAESKESQVWKGTYRETTAVAVKKMKRMEAKRFGEECQMMKSLHHPNIVQYLGHNMQGEADSGKKRDLAEYARGQEMSVDSMLTIASDVSKGLSYIGSMGKVHTAVIPSKIVIIGHGIVTAKLCSFGCTVDEGTQVREGERQTCMAPEVEREGRWTESGHVWSVGVLLWAMASRRMDVYNSQKRETYTTESMTDERVAGVIQDSVKERTEERVSLSEMTRRMAPEEKKKNWETQPHQIDNVYVEKYRALSYKIHPNRELDLYRTYLLSVTLGAAFTISTRNFVTTPTPAPITRGRVCQPLPSVSRCTTPMKCQQELDDECPLYESDEMRGTFGGSPSTSKQSSRGSSDLVSGRPLETGIASCPKRFILTRIFGRFQSDSAPFLHFYPLGRTLSSEKAAASLSDIPGPPRMRVCLLLIFFLTLVLSPTSAQTVVDSLRDVWLTAGGSLSYYRGQNPCNTTDFLGVTCTKGTVTGLSLPGTYKQILNGTLSPSIGQLTNLTSLNISSTRMNGQIPSTVGQLQSLIYLQLSNSNFNGPLPSSLGNLYNLQTLNVSNNLGLSGSIDVLQGCTNLTSIAVNINNFSGEIPPFVFNSSITVAVLADNRLAYPPNVIFSSPSKLTSIQFAGLRISGDLPSYLYGNLMAVQTLLISNNNIQRLQDNFASSFPSITQIDLGNNNGLTSIPSLVSMKNLARVELYNNVNLRNLSSLMVNLPQSIMYLRLDGTNVEGTLDGMSSLLPNLVTLIMNNVRLSGDLSGLTSLYNLKTLSMSKAFQGSIANRTLPASFGSLRQLMTVDLS
ncbi:putative leucine-rich repeat receptor-like protein kinase, partial [Planoprotostelium fungivorum]